MKNKNYAHKICQSCGMPIEDPAQLGKTKTGQSMRITANIVTKMANL